MHSYWEKFFIYSIFVILTNYSNGSLSFDSSISKSVLKLCQYANNTCIDDFLSQKFVVLNSKSNQNITVKLGNLRNSLQWTRNDSLSSKIYADRQNFVVSGNSLGIIINTVCEFDYPMTYASYLDNSVCCRVELELNNAQMSNPFSYCELFIGESPIHCFFPINFPSNLFLEDKIFPLVGKIYKKQFNSCKYPPNGTTVYAISKPLMISFSSVMPVIWQPTLNTVTFPLVLIGVPLHSVTIEENILIPVRLISDRTDLNNRFIEIQCLFDQNVKFHSVKQNFPNVSELKYHFFSQENRNYLNIDLQVTPGLDQQLMSLNVTVSERNDQIKSIEMGCFYLNSNRDLKTEEPCCILENLVKIPVEVRKSMIIPLVKETNDIFAIYAKPNISIKKGQIRILLISNYKDRTTQEIREYSKYFFPVDSNFLSVSESQGMPSDISIRYQTYLSPWSVQIKFFDTIHTLISPVRIWRPESWKLVLSEKVLQPIKNWDVPQSNKRKCAPRYKVVRLKILCRLYIIEETGEKRYIGKEDDNSDQIPYIDVTSLTSITQLQITPPDIISVKKSEDENYFLIYAKQLHQDATIRLTSMDSKEPLSFEKVTVGGTYIHIVDLIVHCVDAIKLANSNRTIRSVKSPDDHTSFTVSLTSEKPSQPCYLVIFVVFNDKSIERISTVNINEYRLIATHTDSQTKIPVNDSQLVSIKQFPHVNLSLYIPSLCQNSHPIFTKKIDWTTIDSVESIVPIVTPSAPVTTEIIKLKNSTNLERINDLDYSSIKLIHITIYVCTTVIGLTFIGFILFKLLCSRNGGSGSRNNGNTLDNYPISVSGFMEDPTTKMPIRTSNTKNFSALGKCSANCLRQNPNKNHTNEPYPPLLPPPGPIAANYDLTNSDPVCNDSAVDSGVEVGKLSSYSSNTCPSNDLCYTMDLYPPCTSTEESMIHQQYQAPHYTNPIMGFYQQKPFPETNNHFNDSVMLTSLNSTKTISNLRHAYW